MGRKVAALNDWNFDAEVIAADVPVCVIFGTSLDEATFELARMLEEVGDEQVAGRLKVAEFTIDEAETTWREYNVRQVPTAILFQNGDEKASFAGEQDRSFLSSFLGQHLSS